MCIIFLWRTVYGERYEKRLECSSQLEAGGARDAGACTTIDGDGGDGGGGVCGYVTCACLEPRRIAVFAKTILPQTRRRIGSDYGHEVFNCSRTPLPSTPSYFLFTVMLLTLLTITP